MKLILNLTPQGIIVNCEIDVNTREYSFALSTDFNIINICNNGNKISLQNGELCELEFRPAMKKYQITNLEKGTLSFTYSGMPHDDDFAFYQKDLIHLSLYNGWYPIGFDVAEQYDIELFAKQGWELVHGTYDKSKNIWKYNSKGKTNTDCNIILFKTDAVYRYKYKDIELIGFDENQQEFFKQLAKACEALEDFYVGLYKNNKLQQMTIVFLPQKYNYGAYMRDGLVVFSEICEKLEDCIHFLAHELGHAYASGAETDTWEDWLNETHAEWGALLYDIAYIPKQFEKEIKYTQQLVGNTKICLRPNGDKRPRNVHEIGTLIYFDIYRRWGIDAIRFLLRTFDALQEKNTNIFLKEVSKHNINLANFIRDHI